MLFISMHYTAHNMRELNNSLTMCMYMCVCSATPSRFKSVSSSIPVVSLTSLEQTIV